MIPPRTESARAAGTDEAASGAIAAEHAPFVRQLTAVLHQIAVLAYELGRLHGDHPGVDRFEPVVPPWPRWAGPAPRRPPRPRREPPASRGPPGSTRRRRRPPGRRARPCPPGPPRSARVRRDPLARSRRPRPRALPCALTPDPPGRVLDPGAYPSAPFPHAMQRRRIGWGCSRGAGSETRKPERPLGPRRRGAAFSTQPLGLRCVSARAVTPGGTLPTVGPRRQPERHRNSDKTRSSRPVRTATTSGAEDLGRARRWDGPEALDRLDLERVPVVGGEVRVPPGSRTPFLASWCPSRALPTRWSFKPRAGSAAGWARDAAPARRSRPSGRGA